MICYFEDLILKRKTIYCPKFISKMSTLITNGVNISVESIFQPEYSNTEEDYYMYSYRITIENLTQQPIKLLERYWMIFDSKGKRSQVSGKGVIGEQPVIQPNQIYQYVSGCNLQSDLGKMQGFYTMVNLEDDPSNKGETFQVNIPEFILMATFRKN